jgi:hypothetical protein
MIASGMPTPSPILAPVDSPELAFGFGETAGAISGGGVELGVCAVPGELVCETDSLCSDVCVAAAST